MRRLYFASSKSSLSINCELYIASAAYVSISPWAHEKAWIYDRGYQIRPRRLVGTLRRNLGVGGIGKLNSGFPKTFTVVEVETVPEWEERNHPLDIEWLAAQQVNKLDHGAWARQIKLAEAVWDSVRPVLTSSWATQLGN